MQYGQRARTICEITEQEFWVGGGLPLQPGLKVEQGLCGTKLDLKVMGKRLT
jgi:hypothetical protein